MKTFEFTQKELEHMKILERIKNQTLTQEEGAKLLLLSSRQVRRKLKRYREQGYRGIRHQSKGMQSNRAISAAIIEIIINLIKTKYFLLKNKPGPTFIADQLAKNDGITIDHETLRRIMIKHELWIISKKKKEQHHWRERKHHKGELVQVDGSLHIWFGDKQCTLIAFIDDATGAIMIAKFVDRESTENLADLTHEYIKQHGRPLALYSDRGSTYKVNPKKHAGETIKTGKTQYERMLTELDIKLIHAKSPQAKGRVERLFKTLQDRLIKELELAKITTIEVANIFLKNVYMPEHNEKFVVAPQQDADFHRSANEFNLYSIFCLKFERIINNDYTVSFKDEWFQLEKTQAVFIRCNQKVTIHQHFDKTIEIIYQNKKLEFKRILKQPKIKNKKVAKKDDNRGKRLVYKKPSLSHPWRNPGEQSTVKDRTFLKSSR